MSNAELIKEVEKLLEHSWKESEKDLVKRISQRVLDYNYLIPKCLKTDIIEIIKLSRRIKTEYEELLSKKSDFSGHL